MVENCALSVSYIMQKHNCELLWELLTQENVAHFHFHLVPSATIYIYVKTNGFGVVIIISGCE